MSYLAHTDVNMDAEVEALRQSVFEIEQAERLGTRQTTRHILAIAILSLLLFGVAVLLISL